MKLRSIYITGLITILLGSCGNKYEYWDISKFKMVDNALESGEEIKLIYTSQGPDQNIKLEYYIHLIAVSQKTGDTVNILTTADNGLRVNEGDKIFNFFNKDDIGTKIIQMDAETLKSIEHIDDLNKTKLKTINKVARDPKFDNIADNTFSTVIGSIGTMTKTSDE
jgi:hypothetical protein